MTPMRAVTVLILVPPRTAGNETPVGWLEAAREAVAERHRVAFERLGASDVQVVRQPPDGRTFGQRVRELAADVVAKTRGGRPSGLIVLGGGSLPLARSDDLVAFLEAARAGSRRALANTYYSADAIAVPDARLLLDVPDLPSDNALPRWLAERAGVPVADLRDRSWLGIDVDSPIDVLLLARDAGCPPELVTIAGQIAGVSPAVARAIDGVAATLADRRAELLVAGRTSARTLRWLEQNAACRVRALVEERGLRASTTLALGDAGTDTDALGAPGEPDRIREHAGVRLRPPRSVLGMLLDARGPASLGAILAELADAAVLDTRVLLAHRLGADESAWPPLADRLASDLLRPDEVADPWLRDVTAAAAAAPIPVLLGGHTLVGPALPLLHALAAPGPADARPARSDPTDGT